MTQPAERQNVGTRNGATICHSGAPTTMDIDVSFNEVKYTEDAQADNYDHKT